MKSRVGIGRTRGMSGSQASRHLAIGIVLMISLADCSPPPEPRVLAIEKTKSYHTAGCARVHMARTENMSVKEAQARRFHPCPDCRRDI